MAKNFRATGRKKTFAKRYGKRTSTKVVLAQRPKTTWYSPRDWYPPLPAEMRLALKLTYATTHGVDGGSSVYFGISCVSPVSVGGQYPEAFERLMRLYSRAVVDRVYVKVGFTPSGSGLEAYDGRVLDPYRVIAAVIPWTDFNDSTNLTPYTLGSYPEAKTAMLGHAYSQAMRTMTFSIDNRKAIADGHEEHYARRSTNAGVITVPTLSVVPSHPMATFMLDNTNSITTTSRTCFVSREITYHFTFSMRHAAPSP